MTLKDILISGKLTISEGGGGGGGSDLPAEYQRVEYIDGAAAGAVINTGVHPTDDLRAEAKFYAMELTGDALFGTKGSSDNADWRLFNYGSEYYLDYGNGNATGRVRIGPAGAFPIDTLYEVSIYNVGLFHLDTAKIIGSKNTAVTFSEINYDIFLNGASTALTSKSRWYYFKLYKGVTPLRDFIPCYRKSDNVVGMYDTVTKGFFTSVGSGQFTAGPDVEGE